MRVASVKAHIVRYPEPNDHGNERMTVLVAVEDGDGTCGWGEAIAMWPEACQAVATVVNEGLAPVVAGGDPRDVEGHWQRMRAHSWWYGEGGIASMALAAVDMALWDLKGKLLGEPLWRLLGGRSHERLPACSCLHVNKETIEENVAEIAGHIENGFRATKLGFGKKGKSRVGGDPDYDVEFVRQVRAAIGPQTPLYIDVGNGVKWSTGTALYAARKMEEIGIDWIEEPLYPTNWDGYRELKRQLRVPIASGEREFTVTGYERLLATGAIDVFGIDPGRAEGITGFVRAARLIEAAGRIVNAHAWSTAITSAASLALSVHCPNAIVFELKPQPSPMQHELVEEPIWHQDGWVAPNDEPGLGLEPKRAVIEKYLLQP